MAEVLRDITEHYLLPLGWFDATWTWSNERGRISRSMIPIAKFVGFENGKSFPPLARARPHKAGNGD
jgi:hypothetical protein